jgi:hypothetical protein
VKAEQYITEVDQLLGDFDEVEVWRRAFVAVVEAAAEQFTEDQRLSFLRVIDRHPDVRAAKASHTT